MCPLCRLLLVRTYYSLSNGSVFYQSFIETKHNEAQKRIHVLLRCQRKLESRQLQTKSHCEMKRKRKFLECKVTCAQLSPLGAPHHFRNEKKNGSVR